MPFKALMRLTAAVAKESHAAGVSAEVKAADVRALREQTGAGMMDCKKALKEADGIMESAVDLLRKRGLGAAARKADREAREGLVAVLAQGKRGTLVEVNTETDFVARHESFQSFVKDLVKSAFDAGEITDFDSLNIAEGKMKVTDAAAALVASVGENVRPRHVAGLTVEEGLVAGYVHASLTPGMGRIGVLVALESKADPEKLATLGKQLAMHVAAARPQWLDIDSIDPEALAREKAVQEERAGQSGKDTAVQAHIVEGRLKIFYQETVLLDQLFVIDGKNSVRNILAQESKAIGHPIIIRGFCRFAVGEAPYQDRLS